MTDEVKLYYYKQNLEIYSSVKQTQKVKEYIREYEKLIKELTEKIEAKKEIK